jgi:Phage tail assembly chaperone
MAKLALVQHPTFKATIEAHIPGSEPCTLELTFKYRTRKDFLAFDKTFPRGEDGFLNEQSFEMLNTAQGFMQFVVGWELPDAFTPDNVDILLDNYYFLGVQAFMKYQTEIVSVRSKN